MGILCNVCCRLEFGQLLLSHFSCVRLCDPIDSSPPGSPVPGILQARTLEWVAISFSNAWKWSRAVMSDSVRPHGLQPTRFLRPWDFPGKSTGVGRQCLLHHLAQYPPNHPCCCKWYYFILFYVWVMFHCINTPHHLNPINCYWALRLLPQLCKCK